MRVSATGPARRALEARRRRERDALRRSLQQIDDAIEDEAPRELLTTLRTLLPNASAWICHVSDAYLVQLR